MRHLTKTRLACAALALLSTGCSMMPYVPSPRLDRSFAQPEIDPTTGAKVQLQFAGDVEEALRDVDAQRAAYYESLRTRTNFRNTFSGGLIGLSALAVYRGMTATTEGSRRMVTRLGATAGGAYAVGSYADSPATEDAYVQAVEDLTCLALRTRPWLMESAEYKQFANTDIKGLKDAIDALDEELQKRSIDRELRNALAYHRKALHTARTTLRHASHFRGYVETAGFQLRQEAALVVSRTNDAIRQVQRPLAEPVSQINQLTAINKAFRNIKPEPVEEPSTEGGTNKESGGGDPKDPATATTPPKPAVAASAAAPAASASSPLAAEADKLAKSVQSLEQRVGKGEQANQRALQKLRTDLEAVRKARAGASAVALAADGAKHPQVPEEVATKVAAVYKAMRPVTLVLTRAYSLKPYVNAIPQCRVPGVQPLQFTLDADEVKVKAGATLDVGVVGGIGLPRIWLAQAYASPQAKIEFSTNLDNGVPRAVLKLPADLPAGELVIHAVDGSGNQKDALKVVVEAAGKAK